MFQRIDVLVKANQYQDALALALSFYEGKAKAVIGLSASHSKRAQVVSQLVSKHGVSNSTEQPQLVQLLGDVLSPCLQSTVTVKHLSSVFRMMAVSMLVKCHYSKMFALCVSDDGHPV